MDLYIIYIYIPLYPGSLACSGETVLKTHQMLLRPRRLRLHHRHHRNPGPSSWFKGQKTERWEHIILIYYIHPRKLTWNLKMNPWKRRFLLRTIIFRFHVSFRGCNPDILHEEPSDFFPASSSSSSAATGAKADLLVLFRDSGALSS